MIARNYRRFPEALLYQLELALGDVADTIQAIRVKGGAIWANLVHRYYNAAQDVRGVVPVPAWLRELKKRARTLAAEVKNRCLDLNEKKHQVEPTAPGAGGIADLDAMTATVWGRLFDAGIHELDDLAELCVDELVELVTISNDEAYNIIKQARAHWFT